MFSFMLPFEVDALRLAGACAVAFCAGLIDAIAGGGGLVQLPGVMSLFPSVPVVQLLAVNKTSSVCGAFISFREYFMKVGIDVKKFLGAAVLAFAASLIGARTAAKVPNQFLRPLVIVLLFVLILYTLFKKDLGREELIPKLSGRGQMLCGLLMGLLMGFYDGFFGPGTGNFLIMLMIGVYGMDFLHASAASKMINLSTNIAAFLMYLLSGYGNLFLGLSMGLFNLCGAKLGVRLAVLKGSRFIRLLFLLVSSALLLKQLFFS